MDRMRWVLMVAAIAAGICLAALIGGATYRAYCDPDPYHPTYYCADQGTEVPTGLWSDTLSNAEGFWTAVGSLVAVIAFWFFFEQLRAMQVANRMANDAVVSAFNTERGRLRLINCQWSTDKKAVWYEYKNVGRSTAYVVTIAAHIEPLKSLDPAQHPVLNDIPGRMFWKKYLGPGELMGHVHNKGQYVGIDIPADCYKPDGTQKAFLVQLEAVIETLDVRFASHDAWLFIPSGTIPGVTEGTTRMPDKEYEYENRIEGNT